MTVLTLLPYPNFSICAMVLDDRRLFETVTASSAVISTLQDRGGLSQSHPTVRIWEGCVVALMLYRDCMLREAYRRQLESKWPVLLTRAPDDDLGNPRGIIMPGWLGDDRLHSSHRAALLRWALGSYAHRGWDENEKMPRRGVWWPWDEETEVSDPLADQPAL